MQRVLVSGGTGFLGRSLLAALRERQIAVRVLVRPTTTPDRLASLRQAGFEPVPGDIADVQALKAALSGVTHVFHLAGKLLVPGVPASVYEHVHINGTRALLAACADAPQLQRIVHCSTTGVLGATGPHPVPETAPRRPGNIYERSKAQAEMMALAAVGHHALPLAIVRPALVYGPGDLHLLGWFRAIQRGYYCVVGTGQSRLHPIFIDDLVDGMLRAARAPLAVGRIYHLVGDAALPIAELAAAIAAALGTRLPRWHVPFALALIVAQICEALPGIDPARLPLTVSRVRFMTESRVYCGARARRELEFQPQVSLVEGLQRTVAWYRREGLLS